MIKYLLEVFFREEEMCNFLQKVKQTQPLIFKADVVQMGEGDHLPSHFVYSTLPNGKTVYLHEDGTVHDTAGQSAAGTWGYYPDAKAARAVVDAYMANPLNV